MTQNEQYADDLLGLADAAGRLGHHRHRQALEAMAAEVEGRSDPYEDGDQKLMKDPAFPPP